MIESRHTVESVRCLMQTQFHCHHHLFVCGACMSKSKFDSCFFSITNQVGHSVHFRRNCDETYLLTFKPCAVFIFICRAQVLRWLGSTKFMIYIRSFQMNTQMLSASSRSRGGRYVIYCVMDILGGSSDRSWKECSHPVAGKVISHAKDRTTSSIHRIKANCSMNMNIDETRYNKETFHINDFIFRKVRWSIRCNANYFLAFNDQVMMHQYLIGSYDRSTNKDGLHLREYPR